MLIRPRFTDYHSVHIPQSELDFAIPFLNEDVPLYVDPFLMWKSPSLQDQALHGALLGAFNNLGQLARKGSRDQAIDQLIVASECDEVGLGTSATRSGKRIGRKLANEILTLFERVEYYRDHGFRHFEEVQLLVSGVNKDRISDIACSLLKSFLIDYTHQECRELDIPMQDVVVENVFDQATFSFAGVNAELPVHPQHGTPILFAPKRWLRHGRRATLERRSRRLQTGRRLLVSSLHWDGARKARRAAARLLMAVVRRLRGVTRCASWRGEGVLRP